MAKPWLAITAYTPTYEQYAKRLADSCDKHGVTLIKYQYEDTGSWMDRCAETVLYMLYALCTFRQENILWLDADAEVLGPLPFFDACDRDIAAQLMFNKNMGTYNWNTGTIYYKNIRPVRQMLALQYGLLSDMDNKPWSTLHYMLEDLKWKERVNVGILPDEYSVIVRLDGGFKPIVERPLILQHQRSRVHKKK